MIFVRWNGRTKRGDGLVLDFDTEKARELSGAGYENEPFWLCRLKCLTWMADNPDECKDLVKVIPLRGERLFRGAEASERQLQPACGTRADKCELCSSGNRRYAHRSGSSSDSVHTVSGVHGDRSCSGAPIQQKAIGLLLLFSVCS